MTERDILDVFRVNFFSMVFGWKYALSHLRKTKGAGDNVSSVESVTGMESAFCYTASKGAIGAFRKSLAIDEAHNGVRVNALRPGNILTEIYYSNMFREEDSVAYETYQNRGQWMGRSGQAIEMGTAAVFLGSSIASFVTGTTLLATGGFELGEGGRYLRMPWNTETP